MGQRDTNPKHGKDDGKSTPRGAPYSGLSGAGQIEQEPGRGRSLGWIDPGHTDREVQDELRKLLVESDDVDADGIDVLVAGGIVKLIGSVPDHAMRRRVDELSHTVRGTREIHNELRVVPTRDFEGVAGLRTEDPHADRTRR